VDFHYIDAGNRAVAGVEGEREFSASEDNSLDLMFLDKV
jgi:hypothetical protein